MLDSDKNQGDITSIYRTFRLALPCRVRLGRCSFLAVVVRGGVAAATATAAAAAAADLLLLVDGKVIKWQWASWCAWSDDWS